MANKTARPLDTIQAEAIDALRRYLTSDDDARKGILREVAVAFVSAREHFFTKEGAPDWLGRTYAYRRWVRETMSLANVPPANLNTVQAAIRYHVGNVLRSHLDEETVAGLGLLQESPRERSVEKRERHSAVLTVFGGGGGALDAGEVLFALLTMEGTLARITPDSLAALSGADRRAVADLAEKLCSRAEEIAEEGRREGPRRR